MVNNNQNFGLTNVQLFFVAVLMIGIISYVMITIFGSLTSNNIIPQQTSSSSSSSLYTSAQTLTSGEGITSLSVQTYNRTWLNCSTDDYITVTTETSKSAISLWFTNETTEWTSLIKSGDNVYINNVLNEDWNFFPYYISGDNVIICKSDISTFLNVSIDEFRIYETSLTLEEIEEVYNEGH